METQKGVKAETPLHTGAVDNQRCSDIEVSNGGLKVTFTV